MQQVERLPQFAHVADQPLGVLPMRLDAAVPPPPPPSRAVVSAFCPCGFVRRSGMIHSPAPVGRALSHPPLIILLQYLRAPPRRVSGERPHAFVVMEKMGWSWLVYEVRRRLLGNAKEDFTLDPCCRTTGWTENDENCNANTMRRDKRLLLMCIVLDELNWASCRVAALA